MFTELKRLLIEVKKKEKKENLKDYQDNQSNNQYQN